MDQEPRREYRRAADAIVRISCDFGVAVEPEYEDDVTLLMTTMEWVDRALDSDDDLDRRRQLSDRVMEIIGSDEVADFAVLPSDLEVQLTQLRGRLEVLGCRHDFSSSLRRIFEIDEVLRSSESLKEYLGAVIEEGRSTAELLVLMIQDSISQKFREFLSISGEAGNLFDKLIDAPTDYEQGERTLPVNFSFYLKTLVAIFPRMIRLIFMYPNKLHALSWLKKHQKYVTAYKAKPY